jgi:type II secretory pathway component PulK
VIERTRGAALLEALVALALLGTVASAAAWSATESLRAVQRMHAREQEQRLAARFFTAVSLWPREDLDRHLGDRPQGPWRLRIARPIPAVYTVTLSDTVSGGVVLLQTALYREETDR